jgi:hypothetical protein
VAGSLVAGFFVALTGSAVLTGSIPGRDQTIAVDDGEIARGSVGAREWGVTTLGISSCCRPAAQLLLNDEPVF